MLRRIVGRLLHLANSDPPSVGRREFYAMKDRLLVRWGTRAGEDTQRIVDKCWSCDGTGRYADTGNQCRRCFDGVYSERWVRLARWTLGGCPFHSVIGRVFEPPGTTPTIEGRVRHKSYGMASTESLLWLALVFDRRLFLRQMGGTYHCGRTLYPLCLLQKLAWHVARFWERFRRRCVPAADSPEIPF